ncbi:MAG: Ig-like domain-containing protein [Lachnospiraceae bacterium]|nr:Ig-like domain-containing protein [Lachnospiraceae bacterium]
MKRNRLFNAFLAILATFTMISQFGITAFAASVSWPSISSSSYLEITAIEKINVYQDKNCKKRGSSSPLISYNAYISPDDVCKITGLYTSSSSVIVTYPLDSGGTRTGYCKLSDIFDKTSLSSKFTAKGSVKTYSNIACSIPYGSVAKGDSVWLVYTKGSYTYIIYTAKSGKRAYKAGFIKTTDLKTLNPVSATSVKLSSSSFTLTEIGATKTLTATLSPSNSTDSVTWKSSNTSVATVSSSGKVTAAGNGTATITATATSGKKATCTVKVSASQLVSASEITAAAKTYGIKSGSDAYKALQSINTKYASYSQLYSNKTGTIIFLFEGVNGSTSANNRSNAMCVVLKNGKIKYISLNCSTIPDYPFSPSKNEGTAMPTVEAGIYSFTTTNHKSTYAALNITNAKVLRFTSKTKYYSSTSAAINVHRRSSSGISSSSNSWVNSAGCILVGKYSKDFADYLNFCKAVGILKSSSTSLTRYTSSVSGKIVIDRTYAKTYLTNIGYPSSAISSGLM